jgi:hypothetical protein
VLAVDISFSELQLTTCLHSNVKVLSEDAAGKTILAVVGIANNFIEGLEGHQWDYRAKGLLMDNIHILTAIIEHSSSIEVTLLSYPMTAAE